ncbi:para-aminobenzoate synthetase/4-amino-4-deoxychorismate lyase [Novosphingobium kunmingense]|uniref:Probable branched-chain-amino-acid aminotransferase n=1 Tax=Novosphingobium kunmingense TaxID=1211806 RepID=A0A2N0H7E2_9SPHN|nr:aminodeoxychorismate synthase component I [Novosphingobium kunmingense]PKB14855.1 para-aminobenzoate synthetase/4-amino-4-deoxychorismate lyase [Novosphingobium kunmingense]
MASPLILLDDARSEGASAARFYADPVEVVVARRAEDVRPALERIEALRAAGHHLAGYLAYEAGLALETRLEPLAASRTGANGPLVWFAAFTGYETIPADRVPAWLAARAPGTASVGPLDHALSPGGYARAFAAMEEAIAAGDIYQANLTFPLAGSYRGDPLALYARLRPAAGAGYGGVVFDGSHWLLSLSPELFFAVKDGAVRVKPMKGTRPRGRTPGEDVALRDELAASVKDRAENLMIVDLLRNDMSRVAEAGSVRVDAPFAVESYPTVHQMVTTVTARLQQGRTAADVVRALFPCGSITGAPKIRAMELIQQHERDARGTYCGAIGRIDPSGETAFNVAIRTLRLTPEENGRGRAVLGVGSAIVADSDMLPEWRECLIKGGFVRLGATGADLIETMRFTPDEGIPLLELHLERIKASAAELGFAFDRHAVRNAIQALCFEAEAPSRLRLSVARSGAYTLDLSGLPAALPAPAICAVLRLPVDPGDWRLRHKTSDRGFYEDGLAIAQQAGADEALFLRDDDRITEGCFTNVFVQRGEHLITPPLALGLLPGVLRRSMVEAGRAVEDDLTLADLEQGFFIGNALRGLMPARLL